MSWRKESSKRVALAHSKKADDQVGGHWNRGPGGFTLSGNYKWLLESDKRLAEKFRDHVAEYILKHSDKVDSKNRHPAQAWRDGGDAVYVFANGMVGGGHPPMEFAIKIPQDQFHQVSYGGTEKIKIQEHRSGKEIPFPNPLPENLRTAQDVAELIFRLLNEFLEDESNWSQPGSAVPL